MSNTFFLAPTVNYLTKTLSGAISDSATTITLNNTTNMTAPGYIVVDRTNSAGTATPTLREVITYTGISGNDLTGCTRAADGSTAVTHNDQALVETMPTVGMWNNLATIVSSAVTSDGYLKAINSPVSISILQIKTMLNASGASLVGLQTDPVLVNKAAIASLASIGRAEVWGMALVSTASVARLEVRAAAFQSVASAAISEFEIKNQDGNLILRPGTSKLVGISVLRQDDTANSYKTNSVILTGWGYKAPGAQPCDNETVGFGIAFSAPPVVYIGSVGSLNGSNPTLISGFNEGSAYSTLGVTTNTQGITATNFLASFCSRDGTNLTTTYRYGYSWIAIGEL